MTDKQIIIDGVDVSKCEYCLKMTKYRCTIQRDVYKCLCEENPNCYFKQLKRKEQKCEELKKRLESFQKDYSKLYQVVENKGYIKELDQLKAEVKSKTEYIQEQREIIDQYSKKIEMYKNVKGNVQKT